MNVDVFVVVSGGEGGGGGGSQAAGKCDKLFKLHVVTSTKQGTLPPASCRLLAALKS